MEKAGALGVMLDDVWARVDSLELRSAELLLGVPVEGARRWGAGMRCVRPAARGDARTWGRLHLQCASWQAVPTHPPTHPHIHCLQTCA